jgi:hypothetical protein
MSLPNLMHLKTPLAVRLSLAKQTYIRFLHTQASLLAIVLVVASALCTAPLALAQGLGGAQGGITAADLTALRGGAMGAGGGMGGGTTYVGGSPDFQNSYHSTMSFHTEGHAFNLSGSRGHFFKDRRPGEDDGGDEPAIVIDLSTR